MPVPQPHGRVLSSLFAYAHRDWKAPVIIVEGRTLLIALWVLVGPVRAPAVWSIHLYVYLCEPPADSSAWLPRWLSPKRQPRAAGPGVVRCTSVDRATQPTFEIREQQKDSSRGLTTTHCHIQPSYRRMYG